MLCQLSYRGLRSAAVARGPSHDFSVRAHAIANEAPPDTVDSDALGKFSQQRQIRRAQFDIFTEHTHWEPSPQQTPL